MLNEFGEKEATHQLQHVSLCLLSIDHKLGRWLYLLGIDLTIENNWVLWSSFFLLVFFFYSSILSRRNENLQRRKRKNGNRPPQSCNYIDDRILIYYFLVCVRTNNFREAHQANNNSPKQENRWSVSYCWEAWIMFQMDNVSIQKSHHFHQNHHHQNLSQIFIVEKSYL